MHWCQSLSQHNTVQENDSCWNGDNNKEEGKSPECRNHKSSACVNIYSATSLQNFEKLSEQLINEN